MKKGNLTREEAVAIAGEKAVLAVEGENCEPSGRIGFNGVDHGDEYTEWEASHTDSVTGSCITAYYYTSVEDDAILAETGDGADISWVIHGYDLLIDGMTIEKEIKYYSGDLLNGNITKFDTYEEAYADYRAMVEDGAKAELESLQMAADETEEGEEYIAPTKENAEERSCAFHYVSREIVIKDAEGAVLYEKVKTLDGGDAEACGFQQ